MALISSQDRAKLLEVLASEMPSVQSPPLRNIMTLMVALLHDYEKLENIARGQADVASGLAAELGRLSADLQGMSKRCVRCGGCAGEEGATPSGKIPLQ